MHSFAATCGPTVTANLGAENDFNHELQGFEQQCLENADPRVFLDAIMSADCSEAQGGAQHTETDVIPLFSGRFLGPSESVPSASAFSRRRKSQP